MGIGAYLLTFVAAFGLLFTLMIPTTVFTYSVEGQTVAFNANGSTDLFGYIESFAWDFGDESVPLTTTGSYVTHTYTEYGNYTVILTAMDNEGFMSTLQREVTIRNATEA